MTPTFSSITGGYFLAPKQVDEWLEDKPPHFSKLWYWMLRKAFFRDGDQLGRGSFLTTIDEMRRVGGYRSGCSWRPITEDQARSVYRNLIRAGLVTTRRTTRGMVVTVCNYDEMQNPKAYWTPLGEPDGAPLGGPLGTPLGTPPDRRKKVERKNKESSSAKVPADSRYFTDWWCHSFYLLGGRRYVFEGGKDGAHVSFLLKSISLEELILRACDFLTSEDPFLAGKRTLSMFRSWINKTRPDGDREEFRQAGIFPLPGTALKEWQPWKEESRLTA